jgi:hypothetical protein
MYLSDASEVARFLIPRDNSRRTVARERHEYMIVDSALRELTVRNAKGEHARSNALDEDLDA